MPFTTSQAEAILLSNFTEDTYIGLSLTDPGADGYGFNEPPASSGYARAKMGTLNKEIDAQIANAEIIFFNESVGAGYGTVQYFGAFTSKTGGKPFFIGRLTNTLSIGPGYVPIFRAKQLVIGLDKAFLEEYPDD